VVEKDSAIAAAHDQLRATTERLLNLQGKV
jgi:hypothetical protein